MRVSQWRRSSCSSGISSRAPRRAGRWRSGPPTRSAHPGCGRTPSLPAYSRAPLAADPRASSCSRPERVEGDCALEVEAQHAVGPGHEHEAPDRRRRPAAAGGSRQAAAGRRRRCVRAAPPSITPDTWKDSGLASDGALRRASSVRVSVSSAFAAEQQRPPRRRSARRRTSDAHGDSATRDLGRAPRGAAASCAARISRAMRESPTSTVASAGHGHRPVTRSPFDERPVGRAEVLDLHTAVHRPQYRMAA